MKREKALEIARDVHCRYCANFDEPRLKCCDDVECAADEIQAAVKEAREQERARCVKALEAIHGQKLDDDAWTLGYWDGLDIAIKTLKEASDDAASE